MSAILKDSSVSGNTNNGLILYHYPYSYYSHKVAMALYEKHLHFQSHVIDIAKGCQFEPWFLKLNPRGEVPVLQDTGKIIPDSTRIIDYLEDNFSNGAPRLIPLDQGFEVKQSVSHFRNLLDQLPIRTLTYGSLVHSELVRWARPPFVGPIRWLLLGGDKHTVSILKKHAALNSEACDTLNKKAVAYEQNNTNVTNKEEYLRVLERIDQVLTEVENCLAKNAIEHNGWWLCSDRFTVADISLTVLLERLSQLGYEYQFWKKGKKPNIEQYYVRAKERSSYKKTMPGTAFHCKMFIAAYQKHIVIGLIGFTAVVVTVASGFFIIKQLKT